MNRGTSYTDFFAAGGTLPLDSRYYVKRAADDELFELAKKGQFCYVLTARQMGKSSLMIRTAHQLHNQGVKTAIIDLARFGFHDITVQQLYLSLLDQLQQDLPFTEDPITWWETHAELSPGQRFSNFLRQVILTEITEQIVIFIDEIDLTLKLPFRDEFFAAIRAIYNARAIEPKFKRVTFVFLGVASPTDLMEDRVRTPFNIASRIILGDFNLYDAYVLQEKIEIIFPVQGKRIFEHIYRWTNGHPYLTQKLCLNVVQNSKRHWHDERIIDSWVKDLFQKNKFGKDDNLKWLEDFILLHQQRNELLKLYQKVCQGQKVPDDPQSIIHNELKLSGLIKVNNGYLHLRNNIYKLAFDLEWIERNSQKEKIEDEPDGTSLLEAFLILLGSLSRYSVRTAASLATLIAIVFLSIFLVDYAVLNSTGTPEIVSVTSPTASITIWPSVSSSPTSDIIIPKTTTPIFIPTWTPSQAPYTITPSTTPTITPSTTPTLSQTPTPPVSAITPSVTLRPTWTSTRPIPTMTPTAVPTLLPTPNIVNFNVQPAQITKGEAVTLTWSVIGTEFVSILGVSDDLPATGSITVFPDSTTTYLLLVSNEQGQQSLASRQVIVGADSTTTPSQIALQPTPIIVYFSLDRPQISEGESVTISWLVTGIESLSIQGVSYEIPPSGQIQLFPTETTKYLLSASNGQTEQFTASLQVIVRPSPTATPPPMALQPDPIMVHFRIDRTQITQGESVTIDWSVTNVESFAISGIPDDFPPSGSIKLFPTETTTYLISASNQQTEQFTGSLQVNVEPSSTATPSPAALLPPPTLLTFSADRYQITEGESIRLSWFVTGVESVSIEGLSSKNGLLPMGSIEVFPSTTTTYLLSASNGQSEIISFPLEVIVQPVPSATPTMTPQIVPKIEFFRIDPAGQSLVLGNDVEYRLSWQVTGKTTNIELTSPQLGTFSHLSGQGSIPILPEKTTFYILTAFNGEQSSSQIVELKVLKPTPTVTSIP